MKFDSNPLPFYHIIIVNFKELSNKLINQQLINKGEMAWFKLTIGKINTWIFLETQINRTINIRKLPIKIWVVQKFLI
jgi:hypothetical protein